MAAASTESFSTVSARGGRDDTPGFATGVSDKMDMARHRWQPSRWRTEMARRRSKATALEGLGGKRPPNLNEPRPVPAISSCPEGLSLAAYCGAWGRWIEAIRQMQKTGTMGEAPSGEPIQPAVTVVADCPLLILTDRKSGV